MHKNAPQGSCDDCGAPAPEIAAVGQHVQCEDCWGTYDPAANYID